MKPTTIRRESIDGPRCTGARYTHVHSNFDTPRATVASGRAADRTPRRGPIHRAGRPDLDRRRRPRQGRRGAAADPAQRHPDPGTESRRSPDSAAGQHINLTVEIDGRRRTRCYSPASAEGAPLHRADHRPPRRRRWCPPTCATTPGPAWWSASTRSAATSCCPADPAAPHPVRLRRQRHHPGDVDAAHPARRRLRRRDRLRPLRPQRRRRPATPTNSPAMTGVRVLHGYTRDGERRSDRLLRRRSPGRRDARARRGLRVRPARAGRRRPGALPGRAVGELRAARVRPCPPKPSGGRVTFTDSGVDVDRRRPAAAGAGRGRGPDPRKRMPDGHLPHLHPPQDPRRGEEPDHRRGVDAPTRRTCRSACPLPSATSTSRSNGKDEIMTAPTATRSRRPSEDRRGQDRHPDPRAGRGVRPRARRASRSA